MQASSQATLVEYLRSHSFRTLLDAPSGSGWLARDLGSSVSIDGIDLFVDCTPGYRRFWRHDLNEGLPVDCRGYDAVCCCEGLSLIGNPLLLLRQFRSCLNSAGFLIV